MFSMDGVPLEFKADALLEVARKALERKTGARGLESRTKGTMLDLMYDIPSQNDVERVIVTRECIAEGKDPTSSERIVPAPFLCESVKASRFRH